jgi:hypothetical protein
MDTETPSSVGGVIVRQVCPLSELISKAFPVATQASWLSADPII